MTEPDQGISNQGPRCRCGAPYRVPASFDTKRRIKIPGLVSPGSITVSVTRRISNGPGAIEEEGATSRFCPSCAFVVWDALAQLGMFSEVPAAPVFEASPQLELF